MSGLRSWWAVGCAGVLSVGLVVVGDVAVGPDAGAVYDRAVTAALLPLLALLWLRLRASIARPRSSLAVPPRAVLGVVVGVLLIGSSAALQGPAGLVVDTGAGDLWLVGVVGAAAAVEELVFRGVLALLLLRFARRFLPEPAALATTVGTGSLVFAASHAPAAGWEFVSHGLFAVLMHLLVLGGGGMAAAIAAHGTYNLLVSATAARCPCAIEPAPATALTLLALVAVTGAVAPRVLAARSASRGPYPL